MVKRGKDLTPVQKNNDQTNIFECYKKFTLNKFWLSMLDTLVRSGSVNDDIFYDSKTQKLVFKFKIKKQVTLRYVKVVEGSHTEFKKIVKECKNLGYSPHKDLDLIDNSPKINTSQTEYKNIKPNNIKDNLRMDYIARLASLYKLTPVEIKHLISTIQLAFQFHNLTCDDIIMKKGKIVAINNLKFDRVNRKFVIDKKQKVPHEKIPLHKDNFRPFIDRYIKEVVQRNAIKKECVCV